LNAGIRIAVALLFLPSSLAAQGFFDEFSYEGLRFSGIGIAVGAVASNRLETQFTGALSVDYGMIAPRVRVLVGVSYYRGDFKESEITDFEENLSELVDDPTGDFTISVGTVTWSDFAANLDLQYVIPAGRITAFAGAGLGIHFRNGSGSAIDGTFVEDALDTIDASLNLSLGTQVQLIRELALTLGVRGALSSDLMSAGALIGCMYRMPR
jgi:hypothetical protein